MRTSLHNRINNDTIDAETKQIIGENKWLVELTQHEGWKIAREKLLKKIVDLKDSFQVDDSSPEKMLIDLQSRKAAVVLLTEFLREIEGSSAVVEENRPAKKKSYIVDLD